MTLLVGDLASLHDLNALALLGSPQCRAPHPLPLVVVILNNGGGGIFRYLPVARHADVYSPYFDTPHTHTFGAACRGFGLPYAAVESAAQFEAAYADAVAAATATTTPSAAAAAAADGNGSGCGPRVIEVASDKEVNLRVHRALCGAASEAAAELVRALAS